MNDQQKGHCKHGEFILSEGCPECIAERLAAPPVSIVKVRYINRKTGEPEGGEYSYFTEEPLGIGFRVKAPTQNGFIEAVVTALDIPEAEIAVFKDRVKMIRAGSVMVRPVPEGVLDNIQGRLVVDEKESAEAGTLVADVVPNKDYKPSKYELGSPAEPDDLGPFDVVETAVIAIAPKRDDKVLDLYQEGVKLLKFAQARIISTNEDLKPATDDLAIIAKTKKALEDKKADYIGPIREHLTQVNDAFKELFFPFEEANRITRAKVKEFREIEQEKLALAQKEATAKGGEFTTELQAPVPDHTRTEMGTQGFQKVHKWEVVDFAAVPDQYKMIDAGKVTGVVKGSKGRIEIPGIRVWTDETVRINTKGEK